ncbi:CU044_2847 family protein [Thermogemmatispora carboxidivorans]|uniref:CU044_2847 family protein n=1 Tax=Thermogemmatispora carboxidivorans TaxID=1382306 RepID=UPI00069A976E|nr:CU044_2847 family protein [Thermogemmatispora carboxidivorans]
MKKLVAFPLEDGGQVVIEVEEPEPEGGKRTPVARSLTRPEQAPETLEKALQKVLPAIKAVAEKLHHLDLKPDEVEIAFGIKLNASLGAILATAGSEANFDITLHWYGKDRPVR